MKNASTFFIKGTRALVDHAAAAALISGAGRRSWLQHGPGAARHLIRRNGQGFPRPFSWRPVSGPHRGPEAARSRAGLICATAATVQGALASRMQDGHVVVKIQCSLIPCRAARLPSYNAAGSAQASRLCTQGRASIAFVYTRPLAWAMPWNPMPYGSSTKTAQGAAGAARSFIRRNRQGFPRPFSWRPVSGPHRGPGGGQMPRPALLAADRCRSGGADLRGRSPRLHPGHAAGAAASNGRPRHTAAGCSYKYTYTERTNCGRFVFV